MNDGWLDRRSKAVSSLPPSCVHLLPSCTFSCSLCLFAPLRLDSEMPEGVEVMNSTLVFLRPLQRNDSGVYRCEVANDINLRSRDVRILIQGEHDGEDSWLLQSTPPPGSCVRACAHVIPGEVSLPVTLSFKLKCDTLSLSSVLHAPTVHKEGGHNAVCCKQPLQSSFFFWLVLISFRSPDVWEHCFLVQTAENI